MIEQPRASSKAFVARLHELSVLHPAMLTGDLAASAQHVAGKVRIDAVHADLMPADKLGLIDRMSASHGPVAMVGDGVNDAPALAKASVGIAMVPPGPTRPGRPPE